MAKDIDPLLEISTALADLADSLSRRDADAAKQMAEALREAMLEVSTPLAELIEALDKVGSEGAKRIAEALASIKLQAPSAPPAPEINIPAPQVTVEMPAPQVQVVVPPAAGWRFEVDYHPNGSIRGMTARRLESA